MVDTVLTVAVVLVLVWIVIYIHELGHYYAGRRIVGIPADDITLVKPYFPQYVALRDGEEWVAPTSLDRYREQYEQYDPEGEHLERYLAAGEIVQAGLLAPVAFLIGTVYSVEIALGILSVSLLTTFVYVGIDAVATVYRGIPSGDYSQLWQSTPRLPVFLLLGFASLHVIPMLILT